MKTVETYSHAENAYCLRRGCSWHMNGAAAEMLARAHHDNTGHVTRASATSSVTYTSVRHLTADEVLDKARAEHGDTDEVTGERRMALTEALGGAR